MLQVTGLSAHYGRAHILDGVALEVAAGEVVVLLGRNGAGKSTTMKAIMGLVPPSGGQVRFAGAEIAGREPFEIARLGLGYVPEERRIFTGSHRDGESGGRAAACRAGAAGLDAGAAVRAVPQPRRHAGPAGRADERRRAADADHRADADGQPEAGPAG